MNTTFDRYAGIAFFAIGLAFVIGSLGISTSAYGSNVGANIFPMILGSFLSLMSLRLMYETFRRQRAAKGKENLDYKRFLIIFIAAVLYAYFLEDIGFVISTFLFLMIGFQTMQKGRVWVSLLIAACFSYGVYYLYVNLLDGSLPGFPTWLGGHKMSTLDYVFHGLGTAMQWHNVIFVFLGVLIGTVVGVLPGIGPMSGVALLIPITATMTAGLGPEEAATSSIILLAGVYYGAMYGGSTTSILLNTPGESSSVVTTLDGYQMAKQGRAGAALAISAIGSFAAGIISLIGLIFLARPLSAVAIKFGPAEYFSLMVLGLLAISGLAGKSMVKALMMTAFGLLLATIGIDNVSGVERFTFGIPELYQGLEFLTVAVGTFAVGEVFKTILQREGNDGEIAKINRILPTKQDMKDSAAPIARGSVLGFFIGLLPGAGAILASFFAYIVEKKISKNPEKFGKGAIEGVASPEAANNAASGGAMIPLLTLGIPSSGTTAILMGAFIMYNVQPGPLLFQDHPQLAWGVIASMFVGNLMLLILNMPLVKVFAKVIETPAKYLIPLIIVFSVFGVYAVQYSTFDLMLIMGCGLVGYFLSKNDYPLAPLVLGLILGPMMENNMRRALTISNGDFMIFLQKPVSLVFLIIGLIWITIPLIMKLRGKNVLVNEEG